ncbi:thioredoxin family protein [Flavobacterium sp. CYK-55]|uniref:thioredoxin family protein n=1 Tax=Flavobacterium sp. CYK-55 TaxID=2835529 RepID=UPI001BD0AC5D|nr:thioredoxin family protein [Flavobacterium sp. CYK-55]MBS7786883.1 thioredoxin family protein [Flavobacterium sp. CYK-55]
MKSTVFTSVLCSIAIHCSAQEWSNNLNQAFREASMTNKKVLLFFSTDENCERCQKLDKNVLQSPEFKDFAKDDYILVKQDFEPTDDPQQLEQNLLVVEKYNKDGFFPLLVILNKNAKVIGQVGAYNNETPNQYLDRLLSVKH